MATKTVCVIFLVGLLGVVLAVDDCVDKLTNCDQYAKDSCNVGYYHEFARDLCRKTCNACDVPLEIPCPDPPVDCQWEDKLYIRGQTWKNKKGTACQCYGGMGSVVCW